MTSTRNAGHWSGLDAQVDRYQMIRRLLWPHLPAGGVVIDVGCGSGVLRTYLPTSVNLLGIEPNGYAAKEAAAGGVPVFEGTAEEFLKVRSDSADAVVFNEMLYYADDPISLLLGFRRLLRPGGVMLVSIFLKDRRLSPGRLLGQLIHPKRPYDNRHCASKVGRFFRRKEWLVLHEQYLSIWKLWLVRPPIE